MRNFKLLVSVVLLSCLLVGCSKEQVMDQARKAGETVGEQASQVAEKAKEAANTAQEAAENAIAHGEESIHEVVGSGTEQGEEVSAERQLTKVTVTRVKDGDTFVCVDESGTEYTVRLIGVDTPESVAPEEYLEKTGKENTEEGKTASDYTKELILDTTVELEQDVQDTDQYGRVLAYVWIDETTMLQDVLLREGYADLMTIQPNVKYADRFTKILSESR